MTYRIRFLPLLCLLLVPAAASATVWTPITRVQFNNAVAAAQPGDEIVLPATVSTWNEMLVHRGGTAAAPLVVRAPAIYGTTITGGTYLKVTADHVVVRGIKFIDTTGTYPMFIDGGSHNRITQCYFSGGAASTQVRIQRGTFNRVDHCYFTSPWINAVTYVGPDSADYAGGGWIEYNVFRDAPRVDRDGEAIALWSDGHHQGFELKVHVAWNVFDNWDADNNSEIVTIKSGGNTFYRNVFAWCHGYFSLRRENHNRVDSNLFYRNTEGIRIFGSGHVVVNNIFEAIDEFGLYISNGFGTDDNRAIAATDCLVAYNTFYNVGRRSWVFYEVGAPNTLPTGNLLTSNIVHSDVVVDGLVRDQSGFFSANTVRNNLFYVGSGTYGPVGTNAVIAPSGLTGSRYELFLTAGSPAIGHGETRAEAPVDFFAQARTATPVAGHHAWPSGATPQLDPPMPPVPPDRANAASQQLAAAFAAFPARVAVGSPSNLDAALSTGPIATYRWEPGDGTVYQGPEMFFPYAWQTPGVHTVTLTVFTAAGQSASTTGTVTVATDLANPRDPWIDADGDFVHAIDDPDDNDPTIPFPHPLRLTISFSGGALTLAVPAAPGVVTTFDYATDLQDWQPLATAAEVGAPQEISHAVPPGLFPGTHPSIQFRARKEIP